jgi:hypothetical protein
LRVLLAEEAPVVVPHVCPATDCPGGGKLR